MGIKNTLVVEGQIRFATLKNARTGAHSPCVGLIGAVSRFLEVI